MLYTASTISYTLCTSLAVNIYLHIITFYGILSWLACA